MSAYSPTLPRTAELQGVDRVLVLVGSRLTALGRRRADARSRALAVAAGRAAHRRTQDAVAAERVELLRDNAAQAHPLMLR